MTECEIYKTGDYLMIQENCGISTFYGTKKFSKSEEISNMVSNTFKYFSSLHFSALLNSGFKGHFFRYVTSIFYWTKLEK